MPYDNNNSGVLFKSKSKQPGDNRPSYRGNCEVNGVKMEISAWIKDSKKNPGEKFMSLKFEPMRSVAEAIPKPTAPPPEDDDAVPF